MSTIPAPVPVVLSPPEDRGVVDLALTLGPLLAASPVTGEAAATPQIGLDGPTVTPPVHVGAAEAPGPVTVGPPTT